MPDRGVSDTIGFVFVFSLIILTASVVSVAGFGVLQDVRDAERVNNAERAFDVLADNLGDIQRENAPSRSTEIKLADASIGTGDPTEVTVTIDGTTYPTIQTEPIVYSAEDTQILYEAGAVIRQEDGDAVVLRDPPLLTTPERTALQFVRLESDADSTTKAGTTTVLVRALKTDSTVHAVQKSGGHSVTIDVETTEARADAWERYLKEATGGTCSQPSSTRVQCDYTTDEIVLSTVTVDVVISG